MMTMMMAMTLIMQLLLRCDGYHHYPTATTATTATTTATTATAATIAYTNSVLTAVPWQIQLQQCDGGSVRRRCTCCMLLLLLLMLMLLMLMLMLMLLIIAVFCPTQHLVVCCAICCRGLLFRTNVVFKLGLVFSSSCCCCCCCAAVTVAAVAAVAAVASVACC